MEKRQTPRTLLGLVAIAAVALALAGCTSPTPDAQAKADASSTGASSALGSESNSTNFEYVLDIQNNTKIGMDVITYDGGKGTTYRLESGAHGRYVTRRDISPENRADWKVLVAPDNYTPND